MIVFYKKEVLDRPFTNHHPTLCASIQTDLVLCVDVDGKKVCLSEEDAVKFAHSILEFYRYHNGLTFTGNWVYNPKPEDNVG